MAYWGNNSYWRSLGGPERAAAMALLEADMKGGKPDMQAATNVLGAMINRASREGADIGDHVSGRIYQPTIEDAQFARLGRIVGSPEHQQLVALANDRMGGKVGDWVQGATHFLAPEKTMLSLEAREPNKYRSWRQWTGFDPATGEYSGVIMRDGSHAFLAPDGKPTPRGDSASTTIAAAAPGDVPSTGQAAAAAVMSPQTPTTPAQQGAGLLSAVLGIGSPQTRAGNAPSPLGHQMQMAQQALASLDEAQPAGQPQQQTDPMAGVDLRQLMAVLQRRSALGTA